LERNETAVNKSGDGASEAGFLGNSRELALGLVGGAVNNPVYNNFS
jgi:hypothetical protein